MSKFIGLNRVCVPLSMDCDLSCRYCYRNAGRIPKVPEFNDLMREFLGQLDPSKTQALVASGGEPLLHWDKVQELFSYAPKGMHLKVMTNGLNLTRDIVDYLNEHKVETWVSYDGSATQWLRGVDILQDPEIKSLVMSIDHLTFCCCCTSKNPDPYKNYLEIKAQIPRHFYFHYNAVFVDKYLHPELVEGFDYRAFRDGSMHCELLDLDYTNPIPFAYKGSGVNVLPNGDLVGMAEIDHKYGTVLSTIEEVIAKRREWGDLVTCPNKTCVVYSACKGQGQNRSPHFCQSRIKKIEVKSAIKHKEISNDDPEFCL